MKMINPAGVWKHEVILFKDLKEDGLAAFLREQCPGDYAACVFGCMFPGFQHSLPRNN